MAAEISNLQDKVRIGKELEKLFQDLVKTALEAEGVREEKDVGIVLCDNRYIQELNRTFRGIDAPTDVLSFENDDGEFDVPEIDQEIGNYLGDIAISLERAIEQAEEYGHSFERELAYLLVHGMLHLLGYDHLDERDRALMREREESILGMLNLKRD